MRFWWTRGHLSEGLDWTERALALPNPAANVRAKALNAAGVLAWAKNSYTVAQSYYEQALIITQTTGDQLLTAKLLNNLGMITYTLGNYSQAIDFYNQSLVIYRQQQYQLGIARALNNLGTVVEAHTDYQQAAIYYEESLALFRDQLDDQQSVAIVFGNLAEIAVLQTQDVQALNYYHASMETSRVLGDKERIALCVEGLAAIANRHGQSGRAARLWAAGLTLRDSIGALLEPSERAAYDNAITGARSGLEQAAWDAEWAAGRRLTLDQVLAEASAIDVNV